MIRTLRVALVALMALLAVAFAVPAFAAPPLPGAIFTTDIGCQGTNLNIYGDKAAVYLDGGPSHPGAAGLPDGSYYVQVTEPNGTVLGKSSVVAVTVSGGEFEHCYQLSSIINTASSGFSDAGYDTTSNPGGEYKVWVSTNSDFDNNSSKTDNFKVATENPNPPTAKLKVLKFYDANANGINDDGQLINGWKTRIQDHIDYIRFTPVDITVAPDDYTVTEFMPIEANWQQTTPNPVMVSLANGDDKTVEFGNLCTGAGGGKTLGFWSNKNGEATMNDGGSVASELALLSGLHLRNANGTDYNPTTYTQFRTWLLSANATNMANMLSAQLAAMELNVEGGLVNGNALIYAPGTQSANAQGFATVNSVMSEANTSLGANSDKTAAGATRTDQEALKNALDKANNNLNFVQSSPCPYTFAH
jgi:hypothetical protein